MTGEKRVLRVLLVEDEMMVAMLLEDMLTELGHSVVGLASRADEAAKRAGTADFDLAILDLNLNGQESYPVARVLRERGVPFVFATGYGEGKAPAEFAGVPTLSKPFVSDQMQRLLDALVIPERNES
jgi:CheY-like chemotaxis protein